MGTKSGKMKYIPQDVINHIEKIKKDKGIKDSSALREMKDYSNVGREVERMMNLGFNMGRKKKKKRGLF